MIKRTHSIREKGVYLDQVFSPFGQCLLFELEKERKRGAFGLKIVTNTVQQVFDNKCKRKPTTRSKENASPNGRKGLGNAPSWRQIKFSRSHLRQSKILNFLENNDQVFSWKSNLLKDPKSFWKNQEMEPFFRTALKKANVCLQDSDFNIESRLRSRGATLPSRNQINAKVFRRETRIGENLTVANSKDMSSIMNTIRSSSVLVFELGASDLAMVERFLVALQRMKRDGVQRKIVLISDIMTWGDSGKPGYEQVELGSATPSGPERTEAELDLQESRYVKIKKILSEYMRIMKTRDINEMEGVRSLEPRDMKLSEISSNRTQFGVVNQMNKQDSSNKNSNHLTKKKSPQTVRSEMELENMKEAKKLNTFEITGDSSMGSNQLKGKIKKWKQQVFEDFEVMLQDFSPTFGRDTQLPPRKGKYCRRVGVEYAEKETIEGKARKRKWSGVEFGIDDSKKNVFSYFKDMFGEFEEFKNPVIDDLEEQIFGVKQSPILDFYRPKAERLDNEEEEATPEEEDPANEDERSQEDLFEKFIFERKEDEDLEMDQSEPETGSQDSEDEEETRLAVDFTEENLRTDTYKPNPKFVHMTPELEQFFGEKGDSEEQDEEADQDTNEEEHEGEGDNERDKPPSLLQLVDQQLNEAGASGSLGSLLWFQNIPSDIQQKLFRPPRPDLVNHQNLKQNIQTDNQDPAAEGDEQETNNRQLGSSHRELRRAQGWYRKLVELETLSESLDSSRSDLRCHILCPGVKYGFGHGIFSGILKKLWVQPEVRGIPLSALPSLGNVLPMIHFQDLATGGKWFIMCAKNAKRRKTKAKKSIHIDFSESINQRNLMKNSQGADSVMGFYESVFENEWREREPAEEGDPDDPEESQTQAGAFDVRLKIREMVEVARKKRKKTSNKDGYVLIWDKDNRSCLGHRLETLIRELVDVDFKQDHLPIEGGSPKNKNQFGMPTKGSLSGELAQDTDQSGLTQNAKIQFLEAEKPFFLPTNSQGNVVFETPFGLDQLHQKITNNISKKRKNGNISENTLTDLVLGKNFKMKRSRFLDNAKSAHCWERILESQKEEGLQMGVLEGQAGGEDQEEEGEGVSPEDEGEEEYDVPGKVEWESDPEEEEGDLEDESEFPRKKRNPKEKILWRYKKGFNPNIDRLKKEFFYDQGLHPKKVLVFGSPLSGKTSIASSISKKFDLPLISLEQVLQRLFEKRRQKASKQKELGEDQDSEDKKDPIKEELAEFYMEYGVEQDPEAKQGDSEEQSGDSNDSKPKDANYESVAVLEERGINFVDGFNQMLLKEETVEKSGDEEEEGLEQAEPEAEDEEVGETNGVAEKVGLIVELAEKRRKMRQKDEFLFNRKNQIWSYEYEQDQDQPQPERDFRNRVPSKLAIELIRKELQRKETQNKGYILDGFPRTFAEAAGLFSKRPRETNSEEILTELLKQKTQKLNKEYAKKKQLFFQRKAEALENSQLSPENTENSLDLERKRQIPGIELSRDRNRTGSYIRSGSQFQTLDSPKGTEPEEVFDVPFFEGEQEWGLLLEKGALKRARKSEWGDDEEEESEDEGGRGEEGGGEGEDGERRLFVDDEVDLDGLRQDLEAEYDEEEAEKRMYSFQNSGLTNEHDPWESLGFNQLGSSPFEVNNSIFPHRVFKFSANSDAPSRRAYSDMENFLLHNRQFDTPSFLKSEESLIRELQKISKSSNSQGAGHFGCEDFFSQFGTLKDLGDRDIIKMEKERKLVKMMVEQGVPFTNLRQAGCKKKMRSVQRQKQMRAKRIQEAKTGKEDSLKRHQERQLILEKQKQLQNQVVIASQNQQAEDECSFLKEYLCLTLGDVLNRGFHKMLEHKPEDYVDFLADHLFENADFAPEEERMVQILIKKNKK